jgi:hypothetical protein
MYRKFALLTPLLDSLQVRNSDRRPTNTIRERILHKRNIHCVISVIMNGIRPDQKTIPTGTNGTEDYTSWQFTGDPNYATVKLGQNKVTTKYSSFPSSDTNSTQANFVKYHSVNVTGIGQQPQQTSSTLLPSALAPSGNGDTAGNSGGIVKEPSNSKIIKLHVQRREHS